MDKLSAPMLKIYVFSLMKGRLIVIVISLSFLWHSFAGLNGQSVMYQLVLSVLESWCVVAVSFGELTHLQASSNHNAVSVFKPEKAKRVITRL